MANDLIRLSLAEAAAALDRREVSATQLTEAALARISELDGHLNAFITVMADSALATARVADLEISAGRRLSPLHGIPISVKDLCDTQGVRTTGACRVFADRVPERDATIVTRLAAAGAINLGKTNLLEVAYGEIHPDFGVTRTPWHPGYSASGSSSGSGAAVAAGMGYAAIGTDTGGSIRCPALVCGIVGHKPTYGLVSRAGIMPLSWSLDHAGPMTRTVRDAALVLDAIAGHDPADPTSARRRLPSVAAEIDQPLRRCTIGVLDLAEDDDVQPAVKAAVEMTGRLLAERGHTVQLVRLPLAVQASRAAIAIMYAEASAYHLPLLHEHAGGYSVNTRERLELGALLPAVTYVRAQRARRTIVSEYQRFFADLDAVIAPVQPTASEPVFAAPPPVIVETGDAFTEFLRFSAPFNLTGQPALSLPIGDAPDGLPCGVQIVGHPFADALLFQLAAEIESDARALLPPRPANGYVV